MIKGFKDFLMRGNVVDLAVAIVIGTAFAAVVKAFVDGIIGGILGAVGGSPSFGNAGFTINHSLINIGLVVNAIIYFVIVAATIYFLVIVPVNHLAERRKRGEEPEVAGTQRGDPAAPGDPRPPASAQHLSESAGSPAARSRCTSPVRRLLPQQAFVVVGLVGLLAPATIRVVRGLLGQYLVLVALVLAHRSQE